MRQILTKRSLLLLAATAAGIAFWALPDSQAAELEASAPPPRPVPVLATHPRSVEGWTETLRFTGTAAARRQSPLGFERAGKVVAIEVEEGSIVEAGAPLAHLDDARLELQLSEAQAALAAERARLAEALAGPRAEQLEQAQFRVQQLDSELERLEREAQRRQDLLAEGVSATEEAETLRFAARAMEAQRNAAQAGLDELQAGTRSEQIAAQRAAVALAEARFAQLQLEIERSVLRAPYAGTILKRNIDEGEVVDAGTPVLVLQESRALEARIGVPERLASTLQPGQKLALQAGQDTLRSVLRAALPQIEPATRSRTLLFDLEPGATLAGVTVAWETEVFRAGAGHAIPATALVPSRRGLWAVYLLIEDAHGHQQIRRQEVEVLHASNDEVIVRGLTNQDRLVAAGTDRVVPGQFVATPSGE